LIEGKNIKDSAKNQLEEAKNRIAQTIRGSGRKRKKKSNLDSKSQNICKK